ncbi:hypothetical protein NUW54_g3120 [Trametes sanguinea]|uniref:Uncharacterized protein n=1 Tax=Trametes sanguinea TaxID=158606 RepID=A0ACC1Q3B1_9APHY|nr:hypothetical protein NUW54_g3120 [Trametes sanguinea]
MLDYIRNLWLANSQQIVNLTTPICNVSAEMYNDREDDDVVEIPLYIHVPPRRDNGQKRALLVSIVVEMINTQSTWVEASWDEVEVPHPYQPAPELPPPAVPHIDGVRVYMPSNALQAPVYILVRRINGCRLLIAMSVNEMSSPDGTVNLDIKFETTTLGHRRRTSRARPVATWNLLRGALLSTEHYATPIEDLVLMLALELLSRTEPAADDTHRLSDSELEDENTVEAMLL